MIRIGISVALEKQISYEVERGTAKGDAPGALSLVLSLIDAEHRRNDNRKGAGMGYKEILTILRETLGDRLVLPPSPSTAWIIRQVNRAREIGLDATNLRAAAERCAANFNSGGIEAEYIIRQAPRLLADTKGEEYGRKNSVVFTGRTTE